MTSGDADGALLVVIVVVALLIVRFVLPKRRRKWTNRSTYRAAPNASQQKYHLEIVPKGPVTDPAEQMRAISGCGFETVALLNREEAKLLPILERIVRSHGDGHRVMAQTSLGELIRPKVDHLGATEVKAAFSSINSKRLDFAIINRFGHLVLAVEYQGTGHHMSGDAFMRDAVKREAIRKAGVPFLEVPTSYEQTEIVRQVRAVLVPDRPATGSSTQTHATLTKPKS